MPTEQLSWVSKTKAVLLKDIKSELRTRYAIGAIVMFAVVTVIAVGFAAGGTGFGRDLQGMILWLVIYFGSVAGLSQSFVREEENRTAFALRIYAMPSSVFGGKYLFNLILLTVLVIVIIPLYALFVGIEIECFPLFFTVVALGILGLAGSTTIIAAIISKASIKGVLFAVMSFPLILPLLIMAILGTQKALYESTVFLDGLPELKVLISYAIVMTIAGFLLFEYVWND